MSTTGTYAYNPALSSIVLDAYARIQLRGPALTAEHLRDAANEANYLLVEWGNKQPLLWTSGLISQALTQGTSSYTLPAETVMVLIAYIETGSGANTIDRVLAPLSTVEYASIPNKNIQGPPTVFWFNRQVTPTISVWQPPDGNGPYTLKMQTVRQVQDASLPSGLNVEVPYRALDAFAAGLAHRLARIHAPALEAIRKQDAMDAWGVFATQDTENVPVFIYPGLGGYFR